MGKLKQRYLGHSATQDWAGWECDCGERFATFDDWKRHADEIADKSRTTRAALAGVIEAVLSPYSQNAKQIADEWRDSEIPF